MNSVQERELAIYTEIAKICDKHKLRYFAIGGTCIGAVRHKGFIPWDDDIDIALPRKDYELFRTIYYKELPMYYIKIDYDISHQHPFLFTKIHDSRATFVEIYAKDSFERYTGPFVDIMPIDGLPDNQTERQKVIRKMRFLDFMNKKCRKVPLSIYQGSIIGPIKYLIKKELSLLIHNRYSDKVRELGERYDFDKSKYCIFTWRISFQELRLDRVVFTKRFFDKIVSVPFENTTINIPQNYDDYLRQDFGEYMKLPPKEQRQKHDIYVSDMNTPCKVYAERDMEVYEKKYSFWRKLI